MRSARRGIWVVWFVCSFLLATASGGRAEERVVNSVLTYDHPSVGALVHHAEGESRPHVLCSATLVGCSTVVTAAHCVCPETYWCPTGTSPAADFRVFFPSAGSFAVESITVAPGYVFELGGDVAVLKLATPVPNIAPTPINRTGVPSYGTPVTMVGFGRDHWQYAAPAPPASVGIKRRGGSVVAACHEVGADAAHLCIKFTSPAGAPGTDSGSASGDSGGPFFIDHGCGPMLAGIVSGGLAFGSQLAGAWYALDFTTDVFRHRDFLEAQAGADLDAITCGTGGQVGGPGTTVDGFTTRSAWETTRAFTVPPDTAELRIGVTVGEGTGNAHIFVGPETPPTPTQNACALTGVGPRFCAVANPTPGTWWAVVQPTAATQATEVQVTLTTLGTDAGPVPSTDGAGCDDRSPCTTGDVCAARVCTGVPAADGTACTDDRPCTTNDTCQAGVCVGGRQPRTHCQRPMRPRASKLKMYSASKSDRFVWSWKRGPGASFRGGGVPGQMPPDQGFALCLYDDVDGVTGLVAMQVTPGDLPIWRTKTSATTEIDDWIDKRKLVNGLKRLKLKHAGPGKDQFVYDGTGHAHGALPFPVRKDPAFTAQLVETVTDACWEARFSTAVRNDARLFQAVSD
jgi:secreted trypsin-like serine protease